MMMLVKEAYRFHSEQGKKSYHLRESAIELGGRMAVRSRCVFSEIWSQMWRHNRAVEWADLGFVGFCPERQISVWNGRSNQLEDMSIK
ncbi:hypothetical protein SDJN02_01367, partial [Cucurbita argyrosperma subsp. argyrosperma]